MTDRAPLHSGSLHLNKATNQTGLTRSTTGEDAEGFKRFGYSPRCFVKESRDKEGGGRMKSARDLILFV